MFELAKDLFHEVIDPAPGAVAAAPSADLTPAELVDRIAATERVVNALLADQARDIAAFADARDAEDEADGITGGLQGRTTATELALALGVAPMTAATRVNLAAAAVTDHPALLGLLGSGRVSMAGLRCAIKQTDVLEPTQRRVVDLQLACDAVADRLTPGKLERAAAWRTQAADADAAAKRAARERADRRLAVRNNPDGTALLWGKLRGEEGLAVYNSLDARARAMRADGYERSLQDLMCDLLVESVTGQHLQLVGGSPPPSASPLPAAPSSGPSEPDPEPWDVSVPEPYAEAGPPTTESPPPPPERQWRMPAKVELQVVMSAATLLGLDDDPAMLRGYGAVPREVVHEIVESASSTALRGLFCDPVDGRLVAMDAATRCFTGGLRQFELFRDQRCRLSDGRIVDIDHVVAVQDGGQTTAGNGEGLGKNPHVVKDHPGVSVSADPSAEVGDGLDELRRHAPTITWTMPTGHSYRLPPPPALGWGSRPSRLSAPRRRDTQDVLDEIRARLGRHNAARPRNRTARQDRRHAARRERQAARQELASWRQREQARQRQRREAVKHRAQRGAFITGAERSPTTPPIRGAPPPA